MARDLHQKVEGYNKQVLEGIKRALVEIDKREVRISELKTSNIHTFHQPQEIKGNLVKPGQ